jgi:agmatine deiminase
VGESDKELIVVAAPRAGDPYYADQADAIFEFHIAYAEAIEGKDDLLVLTDEATYSRYAESLGKSRVAIAPQEDIWTRDFSLSNASAPLMFRYTAAGQGGGRSGQDTADDVQEVLAEVMEAAELTFAESDLLNDGGNYVDDYAGMAVVSRKFLVDNELSEDEARALIIEQTGAQHIAFIEADEQGGLEHADGVVAFIEPGVLVTNSYPVDADYEAALIADLKKGLPGVRLHQITTPYDGSEIFDERFGSACGLYTNMLVTPDRIYLPQFGIPEDAEALEAIREWTKKEVVPVRSDAVCQMGEGVRCMSWQLRGQNARKLQDWADRSKL